MDIVSATYKIKEKSTDWLAMAISYDVLTKLVLICIEADKYVTRDESYVLNSYASKNISYSKL